MVRPLTITGRPDNVIANSCFIRKGEAYITFEEWCEREVERLRLKGVHAAIIREKTGEITVYTADTKDEYDELLEARG